MAIRVVLLDLDDTLVDENPGRRAAREMTVKEIVGRHGHLNAGELGRRFDETSNWFWSDAERHRRGRLDMPAARREILGIVLESFGVGDVEFAAAIVERYQALRDETLVLCEGTMGALETFRRRYRKLGMITNGAGPAQRVKIRRFGFERFFDHIQVEGELGRGKPDLQAFRHALHVLSAVPEETVMIGNDEGADILPALELGMRAVHICAAGEAGKAELLEGARHFRRAGVAEEFGMNAIVLSIGDELVSGLTVNSNASWISQQLSAMGVGTLAHVTVADQLEPIVEAIKQAAESCDVLLISGGLGPTEDDLTRQGLAAAMGEELIEDAGARAEIENYFQSRGWPMAPSNAIQAMRPKSARCLSNSAGTAPGLVAKLRKTEVFVMPGVPKEMKVMFERWILPALQARTGGVVTLMTKVNTFGMGESRLGAKIKDLMPRQGYEPGLTVGTTVHEGIVSVRIYATGTRAETQEKTERVRRILRERLGELIFGENEQTLEEAVNLLLRDQNKTVATAESCTGGLVAELITNVPGSSAVFLRGWVTYTNQAKVEELGVAAELLEKHGAVSEEVALAMAEGARNVAKTDFGIGITGIAGPDGGTEKKPVGTVWIGLSGESGTTAQVFHLAGDRRQVRLRAAQTALYLLRNKLLPG